MWCKLLNTMANGEAGTKLAGNPSSLVDTRVMNWEFSTSWHVSIAAESIVAALFARFGYDVSVQYGANQPEYDLMVAKGEKMLKVSVKGSQDGSWGLCQSFLTKGDADYHQAIDKWRSRHKPRTVLCFV
jgi:hypothetical protein